MSHNIKPFEGSPDECFDRIEKRISGRHAAGEIADLLGDVLTDRNYLRAFVEELQRRYAEKPTTPAVASSPVVPIGRLGATVMPFGEWRGKTLDEVPLAYLDWLCGEQEQFYRVLRAYLKHPELESRRRGLE